MLVLVLVLALLGWLLTASLASPAASSTGVPHHCSLLSEASCVELIKLQAACNHNNLDYDVTSASRRFSSQMGPHAQA